MNETEGTSVSELRVLVRQWPSTIKLIVDNNQIYVVKDNKIIEHLHNMQWSSAL